MKNLRFVSLLLAACISLVAVTVAVAVAVERPEPKVSNLGVQVEPPDAAEADFLLSARVNKGDVKLLGQRAGVRFYVGRSETSGEPCFMTGLARGDKQHFGIAACRPAGTEEFPSPTEPILDYSPLRRQLGDPHPTMQWSAGFAIDAVATIGIVDIDDHVLEVRVSNNIYGTRDVPSRPVKAIVAYDKDRRELYRMSLEVQQDGTTPK